MASTSKTGFPIKKEILQGLFAGEPSEGSASESSDEDVSIASYDCDQPDDDSEMSASENEYDSPSSPEETAAFIQPKGSRVRATPAPDSAEASAPAKCGRPARQGCALQPPSPLEAPYQPPAAGGVTARDGTVWSDLSVPSAKAATRNILTEAMGSKNLGGASSPLELFNLFFPITMLEIILRYTNEEGLIKRGFAWVNCSMMELRSFIGLLFFLGLTKSGHERVKTFWRPGFFSRPLCECTMAGKRFQDILGMLCFDDRNTRAERKATDNFAPMRDVFEIFRSALVHHFSPSENLTVDEQLVAFRGRCSFKQYMPKKLAKYGLKFWASVDSNTHYIHNMQPYIGNEQGRSETELGARVVKDLVEPVFGTGRNVTADSFFVSKALADYLWTKKMTLVGTIKENRKEVPDDMRKEQVRNRQVKSSHFRFSGLNTLVSFVPKQHRNVLLLSSMHHDATTNPMSQKPEIIDYYNSTKAGVDTVDQMCSIYNCARISNRWPMVVFFHLMNCAAINAYVLFRQVHPRATTTRHDFLEELIVGLTLPQIEIRRRYPERLRQHTIDAFAYVGKKVVRQAKHQDPATHHARADSGRCRLCRPGEKRRSTRVCNSCSRFVCMQHSRVKTKRDFECQDCGIAL
ncbi:piggyBac transposable element-derived protein 4-like [Acanthaster planci]|uniref:PiggyBac transposable element-derived protein 4-like n=1 Tax=Acanthaster planci TaxID=133434 RepID=A0A8B7Z150_ACAPL|nr:piggyBac transposable element-derived protein 4-like [Acanthaster planci]